MNSLLSAVDMVSGEDEFDHDDSADFEPEEDDDDDEPAAKKGRKEEIQWTEQKVYVLVCACKAEKRILKRKKDYL
jgi:hypothetical protein